MGKSKAGSRLVSNATLQRLNRGLDAKLAELERKYDRLLNQFYRSYVIPLAASGLAGDSIKRKHEQRVHNSIRQMVEESYDVGASLVAKEIKRKDPEFVKFTSRTDVNAIENKTTELESRFWRTVDRLVTRRNDYVLKTDKEGNTTLEGKPEFEESAHIGGVAAYIVYDAYNLGVITKIGIIGSAAVGLLPTKPPTQAINRPVTKVPTTTKKIPNVAGVSNLAINPPPGPGDSIGGGGGEIPGDESTHLLAVRRLSADLMFLTKEDPRVDPLICAPLNRSIYDKDEPDIPTPPLHRYCRCVLVPLINEQVDVSGRGPGREPAPFSLIRRPVT